MSHPALGERHQIQAIGKSWVLPIREHHIVAVHRQLRLRHLLAATRVGEIIDD